MIRVRLCTIKNLFIPFNVAKCNVGKVNLKLMLPAVVPILRMTCGAPLEFAGADHV